MIKFEHAEVMGWEAAIRGMRNPMNSWEKNDSGYCHDLSAANKSGCNICPIKDSDPETCYDKNPYIIGPNDLDLMKRLRNAGTDHRKFMRMITVYCDILAPLYWWKEFDTYKIGTVANSCSTMHKIAEKEFSLEDFSIDHLMSFDNSNYWEEDDDNSCFIEKNCVIPPKSLMEYYIIPMLNTAREKYLATKDKKFWWQMIQLLPSSYNQRRTIQMNYEVLANIYRSRRGHKLDEWNQMCDWIEELPYSELITGENEDKRLD